MLKLLIVLMSSVLGTFACSSNNSKAVVEKEAAEIMKIEPIASIEKVKLKEGEAVAYFASGCFWCVEAVFESVKGVSEAVSGYAEGTKENAHYDIVSSGRSKHVEAVQIFYDPKMLSYEQLVRVFFGSQDPTTLNRQGPDAGFQYRSALYFQNENEKAIAEKIVAELEAKKTFSKPIVTDITPFTTFFAAEDYHQDYEKNNPNQPYIRGVSVPRLNKFKKAFPELLKASSKGH